MTSPPARLEVQGRGDFLAVPGVQAADIEAILRLHEACAAADGAVLKRNLGTLVTRIRLDSPPAGVSPDLVVKATPRRPPRFSLRWGLVSRCCRDFDVHSGLGARDVDSPRPVACTLRARGGRDVAVSELVRDAMPLRDLLWLGDKVIRDDARRALLFERLGSWLRALHERGVWQRDLKPSNVLVREAGFTLVDITDVRLCRRPLDASRRERNLAQLLDLTPELDGERRWPLLRAYVPGAGATAMNELAGRVDVLIARRRDHRQSQCGFRYVDEEHFRRARTG